MAATPQNAAGFTSVASDKGSVFISRASLTFPGLSTLGFSIVQGAGGRPIGSVTVPRGIEVTQGELGAHRATRGSVRLALVLAVTALLALSAWLVAGAPSPSGDFQAIVVQGALPGSAEDLRVIAVTPDGREREIASAMRSDYDIRYFGHRSPIVVSAQGVLAFNAGGKNEYGTFVLDLIDGGTTTIPSRDYGSSLAFDAQGRLWMARYLYDLSIYDPATDSTQAVPLDKLPPQARLSWSPNGLVLTDHGDAVLVKVDAPDSEVAGTANVPSYALLGSDGEVSLGVDVPLAWPKGSRAFSASQGRLGICGPSPEEEGPICPDEPSGSVVSIDGNGAVHPWVRDEPDTTRIVDASWDAADVAPFVLLDDRVAGGMLALGRVDNAGRVSEIVSFVPGVGSVGTPRIAGLAPDDSLVGVSLPATSWMGGDPVPERTALVSPGDGRTTIHDGQLAAILTSSVVDAWPGGSFGDAPEQPSASGSRGLLSGLPPIEIQAEGTPASYVEERLASSMRPGEPKRTVLGPFVHGEDDVISVACSGLSDIEAEIVPDGDGPKSSRCLGGSSRDLLWRVTGRRGQTFTVTITADNATSWRLVVFDLESD